MCDPAPPPSLPPFTSPPAESKAAPAVASVSGGSGGDGEYSTARESARRAAACPVEELRERAGSALP